MKTLKPSRREKKLFRNQSESRGFIRHYLSIGALLVLGVSVIGVVLASTHENISGPDRHIEKLDITGLLEEKATPPSKPTLSAAINRTNSPIPTDLNKPGRNSKAIPVTIPNSGKPHYNQPESIVYNIKSGDNLSTIFDQHGIHSSLGVLLGDKKASKVLSKIMPGQLMHIQKDSQGLKELMYEISPIKRLKITRNGEKSLSSQIIKDEISSKRVTAEGQITSSLFLAGKEAGISDSLIMDLVNIFAYDIDFALNIRRGDSFKVVYDERYANGKQISDGPIVAAEFMNRSRTIRALRFEDSKGKGSYYTPEGRSMKKAFIRTPVKFTRISSKFSLARKHPILHKIRAHKGVDYAAPTGTPVKSTGKGVISFVGRKGGYGKVVIVKHGNKYSTLYAHLNNFRKGLKKGSSVNQGQVIGYVGRTGSATGPHLHYEFRVNGKHKNPLTVKLPNAPALGKKQLAQFKKQTSPLLKQLQGNTKLASN